MSSTILISILIILVFVWGRIRLRRYRRQKEADEAVNLMMEIINKSANEAFASPVDVLRDAGIFVIDIGRKYYIR